MRCELEGMSLVLLGNFNPSIFQPAWLARHGLVREEEAEHAVIEIIRPEVSIFSIADLKLLVQQDRFQIDTSAPEAASPLRDLALGTFRILEHTPISAMGFNRQMHFKMPSEKTWHTVGHRLAPKELWEGLVEEPGTRSVVMQAKRSGSPATLHVKVEPSSRVRPGVYIGTNESFDEDGATFIDTLSSTWDKAQREARQIAEGLLARCLEPS